jgi:hypothetical protein
MRIESILAAFILAGICAGIIFLKKRKQGFRFVDSFDKAMAGGGASFVIGACLSLLV